jgi:hypothetical protein
MNSVADHISLLLGPGLEAKELTFLQISLRVFVVFLVALAMVRLSDRRGLTKKSLFDQILIVILASALTRAINGSSAFFATIWEHVERVKVGRLEVSGELASSSRTQEPDPI